MPAPFADILFWTAIAATALAQAFILRSTARGMRNAVTKGRTGMEWMWAILPAVSLVILFMWTWRTMHPPIPEPATTKVTSAAHATRERS